jgi:hypothetical protein
VVVVVEVVVERGGCLSHCRPTDYFDLKKFGH